MAKPFCVDVNAAWGYSLAAQKLIVESRTNEGGGMRRVLFLTFIAMAAPMALAQDPVKVDANHYKVILENDQVRVLRIHYNPKEKSVMHEHPSAVVIFLST